MRVPEALERLEERRLLSGGSAVLDGGVLRIEGTRGEDLLGIQYREGKGEVMRVEVERYDPSLGHDRLLGSFKLNGVRRIVVRCGEEDDTLFVSEFAYANVLHKNGQVLKDGRGRVRVSITAFGNGGRDALRGGAGDDRLEGGDGDDYLAGLLGNDEILGGGDDDRLIGGDGLDDLDGGSGRDTLFGNTEYDFDPNVIDPETYIPPTVQTRDRIKGGSGRDVFATEDRPRELVDFSDELDERRSLFYFPGASPALQL